MKSIMQKILYVLVVGLFGFTAVSPVYAAPGLLGRLIPKVQQEVSEVTGTPTAVLSPKAGLREDVQNKIGTKSGFRPGLLARAAIGTGSITAINGTTLTVLGNDGRTYSVATDAKTQFRRRFWGKGSFAEMQKGDTVSVIGKWTDDTHTAIQAMLMRDLSIQKFVGIFFGTVESLTSSGWVMTTVNRGSQTVTVSQSTTKFTDRKGGTLTQSSIVIGNKVRVRGLWDRKSGTITEVTAVKDFSIPLVPTGTVSLKPSSTVTQTSTVSPTPKQ